MNVPTEYSTLIMDGRTYALVPVEELPLAGGRRNEKGVRIPEGSAAPWQVVKRHINDDVTMARAWRAYLNLTQAEVARRMGISQAALSQLEKQTRPRKATLEKLAAALDISVEQLRS